MRDLGDLVSRVLVSLLLHLLSTLAAVNQLWKGAEISNLSQGWEENQKSASAEGTPGTVQPSLDSARQLPVLTDTARTAPATQLLLAQCNWKGLQRGKDCSVIGMNRRQKREPKIRNHFFSSIHVAQRSPQRVFPFTCTRSYSCLFTTTADRQTPEKNES